MHLPPRYKSASKSLLPGGFGNAQKMHDLFLGRYVIFKSMHDPANNAQLLNEIHMLSKARSRHIVEIYDVVYDANKKVEGIIIEYLSGRDYVNFYRELPANIEGFAKVIYQISSALADLHELGIVHRDIKLENMRESSSGVLKLFDFGISAQDAYVTKNNRGTLVYAAPELYLKSAISSPAMDVYALGICAHALISPNFPKELQERPPQKSNRAPSISTLLPGLLPPNISQVLDACIDPDPSRRPSAKQVSGLFFRYLTKGQHRGVFVKDSDKIYELSRDTPTVGIKVAGQYEIKVGYDGYDFSVTTVVGDIFLNNVPATVGMQIHEACVITFGAGSSSSRTWITFSASHPEVIL